MLRAADQPFIGQTIVQPLQQGQLQRDHFFEIQHIVDLIMEDGNWLQKPIVEFLDLVSCTMLDYCPCLWYAIG
jgi:hypothetical protein